MSAALQAGRVSSTANGHGALADRGDRQNPTPATSTSSATARTWTPTSLHRGAQDDRLRPTPAPSMCTKSGRAAGLRRAFGTSSKRRVRRRHSGRSRVTDSCSRTRRTSAFQGVGHLQLYRRDATEQWVAECRHPRIRHDGTQLLRLRRPDPLATPSCVVAGPPANVGGHSRTRAARGARSSEAPTVGMRGRRGLHTQPLCIRHLLQHGVQWHVRRCGTAAA